MASPPSNGAAPPLPLPPGPADPPRMRAPGAPRALLRVVTFNLRGVMDRWRERAPLARQLLAGLEADVYCFQEVLTGEAGQDRELLGEGYRIFECRAAMRCLSQSGAAGASAAAAARGLLSLACCVPAFAAAPAAFEAWREAWGAGDCVTRALRDAALFPFFGNSIASRLPPAAPAAAAGASPGDGGASPGDAEVLVLGSFRAAQRVRLLVGPRGGSANGDSASGGTNGGGGETEGLGAGEPAAVWVVNTHLDHACPEARAQQAQASWEGAIADWMAPLQAGGGAACILICGDLNAPPEEPAHGVLRRAGYASAYELANGQEAPPTWPSGLVAPLMDTGEPHCADYVYFWTAATQSEARAGQSKAGAARSEARARVVAASIAGDVPDEADPTLYPSDHLAVVVDLI
ncbi:hypothetical protein Rsub_02296 [Raphidocelis subcapitata]|uniref:Endonuclease/exonuclease/phosphatase domain-containing protein n=1 Tax=Raphidocelis subcapitata TaxID=307507 RepID=A0A2V0NPM6_9CHLO|nr:hypothetical protein Rsub_02296 [Raphidocelis subcapitata]|eukprot:GBF89578.1 hypothetical protein Rsub_02296 [Raphidocelis subcapitata]